MLAQADHERGVAAGRDHAVRDVRVDGQQGEGTLQPTAGVLHGDREVLVLGVLRVVGAGQQHGGHLGVRLGHEGLALGLQLALDLAEVLDDAVVDHGELAAVHHVGVRVDVRGAAVGGPPGVPDPDRGLGQRIRLELADQVAELARLLAVLHVVIRDHGDPGGVVPAVLEPGQTTDDPVDRVVPSGDADDAAHAAAP